jgi:hypothetical protein
MMDNIKEFVNSFTSSEQVKEFLADVSRICKNKNSELRSKEKEARAELKKIAVARATATLANTASGSTVRVLFKKAPCEVEFISAKPDKFIVKMDGKKRSFPYHKLIVG